MLRIQSGLKKQKNIVKNKLARTDHFQHVQKSLFISSYKQQQFKQFTDNEDIVKLFFLLINIKINPLYKTIMPWLNSLHRNVVTNNRFKKVQTINLFQVQLQC